MLLRLNILLKGNFRGLRNELGMSLTLTKNKIVHPNKLVTKHEEFIINKGLATRVKRVKSTIPNINKSYEKKLIDRKKKE